MRYEDVKPMDFNDFDAVPGEKVAVVTSWDEVPQFTDEAEARSFWETHTLADHLWHQRRGLSPAGEQYLATHPERRRVPRTV